MPLPRSGAPSPGQPTQVGACENLGRLLWVESVCACSENPDATSPNKTANKENSTVLIFIASAPNGFTNYNFTTPLLYPSTCPATTPCKHLRVFTQRDYVRQQWPEIYGSVLKQAHSGRVRQRAHLIPP